MDAINSADDLEPLIDYYVKLMGELPGKMMVALSMLQDLTQRDDWRQQTPACRKSVAIAVELLGDIFNDLVLDGRFAADALSFSDAEISALFEGGLREGDDK